MKTMKIIISPAKKMNVETDYLPAETIPHFLEDTEKLKEFIKGLTQKEAKEIWKCNDKLAKLNFERFQSMDLGRSLTPALLSYEGIQYQYMAPKIFSEKQWDYVAEHLRILSGFYGILAPMDGVVPYRLEMQAKGEFFLGGEKYANLYDFWKEKLAKELLKEASWILNLASKEYSKAVEPYLKGKILFLTCIFAEKKDGKVIQKGTEAKMARGEMVRFLAERKGEDPEAVKRFSSLGYQFSEEDSKEETYVFIKEGR